jgi:hypothetical protein
MHSSPEAAVIDTSSSVRLARVWSRKLHYYLGLYLLFFVWLFALTGLVLNHGTWIPNPQAGRNILNYDQPIHPPKGPSLLDDARDVMRQLNIAGEIDWLATPGVPGRFDFRVNRPGTNFDIKVDLNAERAAVQRVTLDGWNAARILHTFTGVRAANPANTRDWSLTTVWALAMDAVAVGLVAMVGTSLWMWWGLKAKRVGGIVALATGCFICGWFVFGLRWIS